MGIFIHLGVSKAVTKEEWDRVYQESLTLAEKLPLAETRKIKIHDIETTCLVRSQERKEYYGRNNEREVYGWSTDGDYDYLRTAECYHMPHELVKDKEFDPDAGDAMISELQYCLDDGRWNDNKYKKYQNAYGLWGAKTQGEPYHMYILAVGCLIEARLGHKAHVYGDITRGQCRNAVEIANEYLDDPIDMPDSCYLDRLLNRISKLPISEKDKITALGYFYLGTKDAEYGKTLRDTFSEEALDEYWKEEFSDSYVGTVGFDDDFNEYMLWGFDLERLCDYVKLESREGEDRSEAFVTRVMDAKLHLKDKNCEDPLKIDQDADGTYSIWTLFAQVGFAGAGNKKVDRYIPIEDIRGALKAGLGDRCDVDKIIDEYLEKESGQTPINLDEISDSKEKWDEAVKQDASEVLTQIMDQKLDEMNEEREEYDISEAENLIFYKGGDKIKPALEKAIGKSRVFLDSLRSEETYKRLLEKDAHARCEWLSENNQTILVRDKDWEKIYTDIENDKESFGRYYPLFRVKLNDRNLMGMCIGLLINDELYKYSSVLAQRAKAAEADSDD
jgi:hypothetical protein